MRRFLILSILIVFLIVSCAGPKKWTKPDFDQNEFKKDREECSQAVKNDPQAALTFEECMVEKGYEPESKTPSDKEKSKTVETGKTIGKGLLLTTLIVVIGAVGFAAMFLLIL